MNIGDIAERLIEAAEIIERSTGAMGPAKAKSLALPYAHDYADKAGWGRERLAEDRQEFFDSLARSPSARQISEAEEAMTWYRFVVNRGNAAALAAWVRCQASPKLFFKDWCFANKLHPETGRRRKDRALERISAHLCGSAVQNCDNEGLGALPDTQENAYLQATFEKSCKRPATFGWRSDPALKLTTDPEHQDFSWAEKRNERRRQLAARKQKAA